MKTPDEIWSGIMLYGWSRKRFEKELKEYATHKSELKRGEGDWISVKDGLPAIDCDGVIGWCVFKSGKEFAFSVNYDEDGWITVWDSGNNSP